MRVPQVCLALSAMVPASEIRRAVTGFMPRFSAVYKASVNNTLGR